MTGGLEMTAGLLLLIPATSRAGAIGSVAILLAAVMTLIATGHTCLAPSCWQRWQ